FAQRQQQAAGQADADAQQANAAQSFHAQGQGQQVGDQRREGQTHRGEAGSDMADRAEQQGVGYRDTEQAGGQVVALLRQAHAGSFPSQPGEQQQQQTTTEQAPQQKGHRLPSAAAGQLDQVAGQPHQRTYGEQQRNGHEWPIVIARHAVPPWCGRYD